MTHWESLQQIKLMHDIGQINTRAYLHALEGLLSVAMQALDKQENLARHVRDDLGNMLETSLILASEITERDRHEGREHRGDNSSTGRQGLTSVRYEEAE